MVLRVRALRYLLALVAMTLGLTGALGEPDRARAQGAAAQVVDLIEVTGVIDPPMSSYIRDRLGRASAEGVQSAIIQLDTPGGLDVSMRQIVQEILD